MGIAGVGAYNGASTYYSNTASKKESLSDARQRKLIVGNGIVRTTHACGKEATLLSLL